MQDTQIGLDFLPHVGQPDIILKLETCGSKPSNYKVLFNLRHSSALNIWFVKENWAIEISLLFQCENSGACN